MERLIQEWLNGLVTPDEQDVIFLLEAVQEEILRAIKETYNNYDLSDRAAGARMARDAAMRRFQELMCERT
jgi:hypothetical protein